MLLILLLCLVHSQQAEKEKMDGEKEKMDGEKEKMDGEKEKMDGEKEKMDGETSTAAVFIGLRHCPILREVCSVRLEESCVHTRTPDPNPVQPRTLACSRIHTYTVDLCLVSSPTALTAHIVSNVV
nr:unnamed protein product [Fasciola hepatica]CAK6928299.1 unnamed protein product [Fasciola hepatica]